MILIISKDSKILTPVPTTTSSLLLPAYRRLAILCALVLSVTATSQATEHLLTLPGIGISAYDSDLVGFGIVAQDVDLAAIDPSLAGIKVTVTTSSSLPTSQARAWSSSIQPNPAVSRGPATWTFTFSQAVQGLWIAQNQTFNSGEVTSFTGAGSLTPSNLTGWQPGITTTANSVRNLTPTATTQNFTFGGGNSTSWSYTHNDTIGSFSGQSIQFRLSHAPEPTRALLLILGMGLALLRRRRPSTASLRCTHRIQRHLPALLTPEPIPLNPHHYIPRRLR